MIESVSFLDVLMMELVIAGRPIVELLVEIVRRWHNVRKAAARVAIGNEGRL